MWCLHFELQEISYQQHIRLWNMFLCRLKRKHRQKEKRKVGKTSEVSAERSHSEEEEEEEEGEKHFVIGGR